MEKLAALNLLRDNGGVDVQVTVWLFILITRLHFENGFADNESHTGTVAEPRTESVSEPARRTSSLCARAAGATRPANWPAEKCSGLNDQRGAQPSFVGQD